MNGVAARFVAEDQAMKSDSFFIWRVHDKRVVKDVVGRRQTRRGNAERIVRSFRLSYGAGWC
jgi:hypothetical protein